MTDYKKVLTSAEVWSAIHANHPEMQVFSSYSAPDGDFFGDPGKAVMFTAFGFNGGDFPVIEARTTWDVSRDFPCKRINEQHEYWLCLPIKGG